VISSTRSFNFQLNLAKPPRPPAPFSFGGLLRALAAVLAVGFGIGLYVSTFVWLTQKLRLEFGAGYWLGAGGLLLLIGVVGAVRLLLGYKAEGIIGVYLLLGGLVMAGFGWRRQTLSFVLERSVHTLSRGRRTHTSEFRFSIIREWMNCQT
jgi:hypothetical protein